MADHLDPRAARHYAMARYDDRLTEAIGLLDGNGNHYTVYPSRADAVAALVKATEDAPADARVTGEYDISLMTDRLVVDWMSIGPQPKPLRAHPPFTRCTLSELREEENTDG